MTTAAMLPRASGSRSRLIWFRAWFTPFTGNSVPCLLASPSQRLSCSLKAVRAGSELQFIKLLDACLVQINGNGDSVAGIPSVVQVVAAARVVDIHIIVVVPVVGPVFRPRVNQTEPIASVLEARVSAHDNYWVAVDAERVTRTKVAIVAVVRNAVAIVAAALLPIAVLGLPVMRAMLPPVTLLLAFLATLLLLGLHSDLLHMGPLLRALWLRGVLALLLMLPLLVLLSPGLLLGVLLLLLVGLGLLLLLLVLLFLLLILLPLGLLRWLLLLFVSLGLLWLAPGLLLRVLLRLGFCLRLLLSVLLGLRLLFLFRLSSRLRLLLLFGLSRLLLLLRLLLLVLACLSGNRKSQKQKQRR